ncbi:Crp/Fnr family transcriptional regulator [Bauldia sp.]|uniref:Crp/Fnr family transcriptional regulator n=1 Tax=Bauldia sp. TaxID=2575872 RepID=UPI003BACFEFB
MEDFDQAIGFVAAGLVFATFLMRTMVPLRILGISSNVAFMTYGWLNGLEPVLLLHAVLLPINVYRLYEMTRLISTIRSATAAHHDIGWLIPFSTPVSYRAGQTVFRQGEQADALYVVESGRIRFDIYDTEIGAGDIFGEVGVFSSAGERTATALCIEDCRLRRVDARKVQALVLQQPQFAYYLISVVSARLIDDVRVAEERLAEARAVQAGPRG